MSRRKVVNVTVLKELDEEDTAIAAFTNKPKNRVSTADILRYQILTLKTGLFEIKTFFAKSFFLDLFKR